MSCVKVLGNGSRHLSLGKMPEDKRRKDASERRSAAIVVSVKTRLHKKQGSRMCVRMVVVDFRILRAP
jgi:hypothetical protein